MTSLVSELRYEGVTAARLARILDVPRVELFDIVDSTMDVAHSLGASGAPAGTVVVTDMQRRGRGRGGKVWRSPAGAGIWLTLLERPLDVSALDVLSLRVGLRAASALQRHVTDPISLKWPNDVLLRGRKLGGILVEVRWRGTSPEWTAIGVGVNVLASGDVAAGAALGDVSRLEVLGELIPAIRAAAAARGRLTEAELAAWRARDSCVGRRATAPARGIVRGIASDGALLVQGDEGIVRCASGSLILEEIDS